MAATDPVNFTEEQVEALGGVISGNIGKARILTTADYNYHSSGSVDDGVALWLLPPGAYYRNPNQTSGQIKIYHSSDRIYGYSDGQDMNFYLVEPSSQSGYMTIHAFGNGTLHNSSPYAHIIMKVYVTSGVGVLERVLTTNSIKNNLTSTATDLPLSANQGKVLNDKIEGRVIQNAGAPTTSTQGTVGKLLEDTTNGKLYQCTAVTPGTDPDPDTYTWTEVGSGGGGGTGAVVELTTADYDVTIGATQGIALWRLTAGLYHTANDVQAFAGDGSSFKLSLNSHLIIIDDSGNQKLIKVVGDDFTTTSNGIYKGFVQYKVAASDGSGEFTQSESVVSTASLMIVRGAAPTSSDVGFRGQLWYDSTNNKLYVNVNRPNDFAGNWKEISLV